MEAQSVEGYGNSAPRSRRLAAERQQTQLFYLAMFCVYTNALIQNTGQTFRMPNYDRPTLGIGLVCVFFLMNDRQVVRKLQKKAYLNIFVFWAFFCGLATYSSYVTKNMVPVYNPITKNILFQAFVFENLCLAVYALAMDRTKVLLEFLFSYTGVLIILNDLLMFGGIRYYSGIFETYLIGSKFDVTCLHMNFTALFLVRLKLSSGKRHEVPLSGIMLVTIAVLIVMIGIRVDCNTGMSGALVQIVLVYACDRWPKLVAKRLMCSCNN